VSSFAARQSEPAPILHHVMVIGGTGAEWAAMSTAQWNERLDEFGKVADHVGARWLTFRPGSANDVDAAAHATTRGTVVGGCEVLASDIADGRVRLATALATIAATGDEFTDDRIARELNAPAEVDPDLVLVIGPPDHLPTAIVWELAYTELLYIDTPWVELQSHQLSDAIAAFANRERRFGGVD
jgi:hypothetical protein